MEYRLTDFLPTTKKELELRGWDYVDVILFSGDAYVDHPSFGAAVIGRVLEAASCSHRSAARLAWRLPRLQEVRASTPLLWHLARMHGLDGQQIHSRSPTKVRGCLFA